MYDKYPEKVIIGRDNEAWDKNDDIVNELKAKCKGGRSVIVLEFYPGVDKNEILNGLKGLGASAIFDAEDASLSSEEYQSLIKPYLTDDRVFGVMTTKNLIDCYDKDKKKALKSKIDSVKSGIILVYGTGASLVTTGDILIYCDLARWELLGRFRKGQGNWKTDNGGAPHLAKFKQGFFFEWRVADRQKKKLFNKIDYLLDSNEKGTLKMTSAAVYLEALEKFASEPFRLVPYFAPEVWGGQWMKEVCGLDKDSPNYAWAFDGVPEENSLYFRVGGIRFEIPSVNVVFYRPVKLLGDRVHGRFGAEFPIRFDFLDTVGGQNLSLQVHPLTEYIQSTFSMPYTQDESYYILDTANEAYVYLGLKKSVDKEKMLSDLRLAQEGKIKFDALKYVNKIPAKKHDHFLIPAGTIHCSATDTMVLEISATPYIFTFKLFDWDRLGLDGLPRPIHIEHGEQVIAWDRDTEYVNKNLVNQFYKIEENADYSEEHTGLHVRQSIETRRHKSRKKVKHSTHGSVNMLNLVEGEEAVVESINGEFQPFVVHYAETFIIPESVKEYTISPYGKSAGKEIITIKAFIR